MGYSGMLVGTGPLEEDRAGERRALQHFYGGLVRSSFPCRASVRAASEVRARAQQRRCSTTARAQQSGREERSERRRRRNSVQAEMGKSYVAGATEKRFGVTNVARRGAGPQGDSPRNKHPQRSYL